MKIGKYLIGLLVVLVLLAVGLYFIHPYAPLLLLLSLIIQAPTIFLIMYHSINESYRKRKKQRREQYDEDGDVVKYLEQEAAEVNVPGFRLLSAKEQTLNKLVRAELMVRLEEYEGAKTLLEEVEPQRLTEAEKETFRSCWEHVAQKEAKTECDVT